MQKQQNISGLRFEVREHRERVRSERAVELQEKGATTASKAEAERELEKFARAEQESKERKRLKDARRKEAYQASWRNFMDEEHREIELRKNGQLARLLETVLAGESEEELSLLVQRDQEQASEGMVALLKNGKFAYKKLEDLTIEDKPARMAANSIRTTWLKERTKFLSGYGE